MEPEQFDVIMNYDKVKRFFNLYENIHHGTIANDFLEIIRRNKDMDAVAVLGVLLNGKPEHKKVILKNWDDAIYTADYYIMWNGLSYKDRKYLQADRRARMITGRAASWNY